MRQGNVRQLLHIKIPSAYMHPQFVSDVIKPLRVEELYDHLVWSRHVSLLA